MIDYKFPKTELPSSIRSKREIKGTLPGTLIKLKQFWKKRKSPIRNLAVQGYFLDENPEEFTYDGEKSRLMIMIIASFNKILFCFSEVSW